MRKIILLFVVNVFFFSCEKVEDDSNLVCTGDCTAIMGKVYTHSNLPVKNILMKFKFQEHSNVDNLTHTRMISKVRTDNSGNYNMNFYLKDNEVGSDFGSFSLFPQENTIPGNVFYPEYFDLFARLYNIPIRNVTIQKNLYIPTLKKIKIKLNNFHGIAGDDYFRILVQLPCGFDNDILNPQTGNNHNYSYEGVNKYFLSNYDGHNFTNKVFEVDCALNELNYIVLGRMKNNIYSEEIIPINVSANTNLTFEYNYE